MNCSEYERKIMTDYTLTVSLNTARVFYFRYKPYSITHYILPS